MLTSKSTRFSNNTIYVRRPRIKSTTYDVTWYTRNNDLEGVYPSPSPSTSGNRRDLSPASIPCTPTFLGALLLRSESTKSTKTKIKTKYHHKYPRTLKTMLRRMKVVAKLRKNPLIPYPLIARARRSNPHKNGNDQS